MKKIVSGSRKTEFGRFRPRISIARRTLALKTALAFNLRINKSPLQGWRTQKGEVLISRGNTEYLVRSVKISDANSLVFWIFACHDSDGQCSHSKF